MKIFVIVTENYYGDSDKYLKVFTDKTKAETYMNELIKKLENKVDVIIVEKTVE